MKNLEAVLTGSDPDGVRRFIERVCSDVTLSAMTDSGIAESCTIPPLKNGIVLNAVMRDEEAMRIVHQIFRTFDAPLTEGNQESTAPAYRLLSIGISNVDSAEARPSQASVAR